MKLVTFSRRAGPQGLLLGALVENDARIVPVQRAAETRTGHTVAACSSMRELILAGEAGLDAVRGAIEFARSERAPDLMLDPDALDLAAPLPDPVMLRCCSVFAGHYRNCVRTLQKWRTGAASDEVELPEVFTRIPGYYKGNHLNLVGPGATITFPPFADRLDFELELAAIIGRAGRDVPARDFGRYVFGYSIFNDASARHPQLDEMTLGTGPQKSKDFDSGNVLGPCIVTADEFDPAIATGIARVNGVEWGRGHASDMTHDWGAIVEYRSRSERMYPAEIIASGCFTNCSGVEHDRFLGDGDLLELEVPGIGVLHNRVAKAIA